LFAESIGEGWPIKRLAHGVEKALGIRPRTGYRIILERFGEHYNRLVCPTRSDPRRDKRYEDDILRLFFCQIDIFRPDRALFRMITPRTARPPERGSGAQLQSGVHFSMEAGHAVKQENAARRSGGHTHRKRHPFLRFVLRGG
jgi:hypothetical protein